MTGLYGRLMAVIAERERLAREASCMGCDGLWQHGPDSHDVVLANLGPSRGSAWYVAQLGFQPHGAENAAHIAANDPAAVIRECAAHRRIVEIHYGREPCAACEWPDRYSRHRPSCETVRLIATIYGVEVEG